MATVLASLGKMEWVRFDLAVCEHAAVSIQTQLHTHTHKRTPTHPYTYTHTHTEVNPITAGLQIP